MEQEKSLTKNNSAIWIINFNLLKWLAKKMNGVKITINGKMMKYTSIADLPASCI